jgi:hypothetical protein
MRSLSTIPGNKKGKRRSLSTIADKKKAIACVYASVWALKNIPFRNLAIQFGVARR